MRQQMLTCRENFVQVLCSSEHEHKYRVPCEGQKQQKFALNSADKVYLELRDLSFAAVGPKLSERAKSLQTDYKGSKGAERSLAELKDFAAQLKTLPNITRHINLAEAINRVISRQNFRDRVTVEQSLLDGHSIDGCCETIEVSLCSMRCNCMESRDLMAETCLCKAVLGMSPRLLGCYDHVCVVLISNPPSDEWLNAVDKCVLGQYKVQNCVRSKLGSVADFKSIVVRL